MDSGATGALKGFGLRCRSVRKEKSAFICYTDRGAKVLRKSASSPEHIHFENIVKEKLYQKSFVNIDRYCLSVDKEPYYLYGGDTYVVTDYIPYGEADFGDERIFSEILGSIGKMHFLAKNHQWEGEVGAFSKRENRQDVEVEYAQIKNRLLGYKKQVTKQGRFSDFDVFLLKHLDFYLECLAMWKDEASGVYGLCMRRAAEEGQICHGNLKEENIPYGEGHAYITNFGELTLSPSINDLGSIIKRHIKANSTSPVNIGVALDIYFRANPPGDGDLSLLRAIMAYPDKFIKLCDRYYSRKRNWIPGNFKMRMEDLERLRDVQLAYVSDVPTSY